MVRPDLVRKQEERLGKIEREVNSTVCPRAGGDTRWQEGPLGYIRLASQQQNDRLFFCPLSSYLSQFCRLVIIYQLCHISNREPSFIQYSNSRRGTVGVSRVVKFGLGHMAI